MKKGILFSLFTLSHLMLWSQTNTFPASGKAGIGTTNPEYNVHAVSSAPNNTVIGVTGLDFTFNPDFYSGGHMNPQIGFPQIGAGFAYYNDGYQHTMGFTVSNKLLWNGFTSQEHNIFRINGTENNYGNFTLEFKNNGSYAYTGKDWSKSPNTTIITAYNRGLNIGSNSTFPVKIYSSYTSSESTPDIYIRFQRVGIGTESPNTNSKLDVNGNIYSNGKIFIGTPDGTTASKIAPYALAVDGAALFTKAVVKLKTNWPDYVFHQDYRLPGLKEIEAFIIENGHLPEMPKADEVERNGIDLGGNQALLLKKIEELTLILIELEKKVERLENDGK